MRKGRERRGHLKIAPAILDTIKVMSEAAVRYPRDPVNTAI